MTVLSIDSGIERTGYAVFANKKYVISALIKTSKTLPTEIRLKEIYLKLKKVFSRIRQVGELLPSTISFDKKSKKYKVILKKAITGISEGQAIVLYKGKKCLGGGVISFN